LETATRRSGDPSINLAFSKQSSHYDSDDRSNPILQQMRRQVYAHVAKYMSANSRILELNAGTGIDAMNFISQGHSVHATDLSDGMIDRLNEKALTTSKLTVQQVSFENLDQISGETNFDYVFSNFGGLNCIADLKKVTHHLPQLLKPGAFVTWVVMPKICPWELAMILKADLNYAFRRFRSGGTLSHLEGHHFTTYYHSLNDIRLSFAKSFSFISTESLGVLAPQPHQWWLAEKFPRVLSFLNATDRLVRNKFPFNRWGDHIIVTFQYKP
jgi:ubiquinone/menaquinone biosynthesis C-methylase UbiE